MSNLFPPGRVQASWRLTQELLFIIPAAPYLPGTDTGLKLK